MANLSAQTFDRFASRLTAAKVVCTFIEREGGIASPDYVIIPEASCQEVDVASASTGFRKRNNSDMKAEDGKAMVATGTL
ncbi:hypothetical protein [Bradyrhizobium sp. RDM4]|uniref:hypothetical protein n=1 Tax=Bradyrhizobium sp. RDM4 TaxID=3378765 RepID=UPI0038FC1A75